MRICFATRAMPSHGRGGMEDHAMALARGLVDRGHDVTVVTTGHPKLGVEVLDGIEVHHVAGTPPRVYSGAWRKLGPETIRRLHAARPFDVLHSQSIGAVSFLGQKLNQTLRLPTVVTFHGTPYDELVSCVNLIRYNPPSRRIFSDLYNIGYWTTQYLRFYRAAASTADAVIATSDQQAELFKQLFAIAPGRLHKVYNGMDLAQFAPNPEGTELREKHNLSPDARLLLCVARFVRDKGLSTVIRALPAIVAVHPAAHLLLVGDGEQREELTQLIARLGMQRHVTFAGYVPLAELPRYFNLCDMFINATIRRNGYDLTMLEAMACGRVVVSSNLGSTPTLIADGVDGLLVPAGDASALAARVAGALGAQSELDAIGHRARAKALSAFGLDTMVEGTLAVYDAVRGAHARP